MIKTIKKRNLPKRKNKTNHFVWSNVHKVLIITILILSIIVAVVNYFTDKDQFPISLLNLMLVTIGTLVELRLSMDKIEEKNKEEAESESEIISELQNFVIKHRKVLKILEAKNEEIIRLSKKGKVDDENLKTIFLLMSEIGFMLNTTRISNDKSISSWSKDPMYFLEDFEEMFSILLKELDNISRKIIYKKISIKFFENFLEENLKNIFNLIKIVYHAYKINFETFLYCSSLDSMILYFYKEEGGE